jgi:hypothetical protein
MDGFGEFHGAIQSDFDPLALIQLQFRRSIQIGFQPV